MSEPPCIRVVDVHKKFGALEVLKGVSFDAYEGDTIGVNGTDVFVIRAQSEGGEEVLRHHPDMADVAAGNVCS